MIDTKQSVMESSKEDVERLNAFNELNGESEQKNKITNYVSTESMEIDEQVIKQEKKSIMKPKTQTTTKNSKKVSEKSKGKATDNQMQYDKLLNGIDLSEFDESENKTSNNFIKNSTNKKSEKIYKEIVIDDNDEDDLLSSINLNNYSINQINENKGSDLDDDLLNNISLTSPKCRKKAVPKSATSDKYTIVASDTDDELLNQIDLVSPTKKVKSIFKKK